MARNNPGGDVDEALTAEAAEGNFRRGLQLTNADGVVEFQTIYPGWYRGRTVHIHRMVHTDGAPMAATDTDEGGQVRHTDQLFFNDSLTEELFASAEPYSRRDNSERLRNEEDNIFGDHGDEPGFLLALNPVTEGSLEAGFVGEITVGVDPEALPAPVGGPDGRPSHPTGGPGGPPPKGESGGPPNERDTTPASDEG